MTHVGPLLLAAGLAGVAAGFGFQHKEMEHLLSTWLKPAQEMWLIHHPQLALQVSGLTAQEDLLGQGLKYFGGKKKTLINIGRKIPVSFGFWESPSQLLCYGRVSMTRAISKNSFFSFCQEINPFFVEAKHVPGQTLSWYKSAQLHWI